MWTTIPRQEIASLYAEKVTLFRPLAVTVMVLGMFLAAFLLIAWDYAIDPVRWVDALPYRLLEVPALGLFALYLHFDLWPRLRWLAFSLSMLTSQALLFPIIAPLENGYLIGAGAPLFWLVYLPLAAFGLTLRDCLSGLAVLAVAPLVWNGLGWVPDLRVDVFLMYVWPSALVEAVIVTFINHLVLQMLRDRRQLAAARDTAEQQARTDALTGLNNRRAFFDMAEVLFQNARRHGRPLTALLLDIDRFKAVNDTHGHAAGDTVIRAIAGHLERTARDSDICGRLGGEEFALILPETPIDRAELVAERLRAAIAEADIRIDTQITPLRITASFGVAALSPATATVDALLAEADMALYAAKQGGRNRVHCRPMPALAPPDPT